MNELEISHNRSMIGVMNERLSHGKPEQTNKTIYHRLKRVTAELARSIRNQLPPELQEIKDTILLGEHPLFGSKLGTIEIDEYKKSKKRGPFLHVRRIKDGIEESYITEVNPGDGKTYLVYEGKLRTTTMSFEK